MFNKKNIWLSIKTLDVDYFNVSPEIKNKLSRLTSFLKYTLYYS